MASGGAKRKDAQPEAEYFLYQSSVGDPKLFVIADHDLRPSNKEFLREHNAYHGLSGEQPRMLDPVHLPHSFKLRQKRKIPPMFATIDGFVVVDEGVRRAIGELEPDAQ